MERPNQPGASESRETELKAAGVISSAGNGDARSDQNEVAQGGGRQVGKRAIQSDNPRESARASAIPKAIGRGA